MTTPQRPRRQRKGDRLLAPGATTREVAVDHAVAPFDRAARDADARWGVDRLPELVSPDTARKYGYSLGRLNEAIDADDPEQAAAWAAVCIRGLAAMAAEAEAAGQAELPPGYMEIEHDGRVFAILRDIGQWRQVKKIRPNALIYSMQEVANALAISAEAVATLDAVRDNFSAAQVQDVRPAKSGDDDCADLAEMFK